MGGSIERRMGAERDGWLGREKDGQRKRWVAR
jgi:hypothetical protein